MNPGAPGPPGVPGSPFHPGGPAGPGRPEAPGIPSRPGGPCSPFKMKPRVTFWSFSSLFSSGGTGDTGSDSVRSR